MKTIQIESNSEHRSKNARKHITLSAFYKMLAIGINLLLLPLTINYLDTVQYGIWVTLLSVMSWINFLDIGLGNGLRNKLTEAISKNDRESARIYISTAYALIGLIALVVLILFSISIPHIHWNSFFNTDYVDNTILLNLVIVVTIFSLFNFVLSLINQIFYAFQTASMVGLGQVVSNFLSILSVFVLVNFTSSNLLFLGTGYIVSIFITNCGLTIYFFSKNKNYRPSFKLIKKNQINDILNLGIKFFVIQIAALIIFATDNMIIIQYLGPEAVTPYNIAYRIFSIVTIGHGLILTPLWSAFTEAYIKNDLLWIKKTLKKLNCTMVLSIIVVTLIAFYANDLVNIWLRKNIEFPPYLIEIMGLYTIISMWNNIYASFLNGIGKIKLSLYISIFCAALNIPLSIYFSTVLSLGSLGVILGTVVCLLPGVILGPVQTFFILKKGRVDSGIFS